MTRTLLLALGVLAAIWLARRQPPATATLVPHPFSEPWGDL